MADDVLKPVEPLPNDTVVVDLTDSSDTTPKKRKAEAVDRSSVALSESPSSPEKTSENEKKSVKRSKKTDEEKESARLSKERKAAEKEMKAAEKEQKAAQKEAEIKAKAAQKEAENKAKAAEREARQAEKEQRAAEKAQQSALKAEKEKEKAAQAEKLEKAKQKQANVSASFFGKKKEESISPVKKLISRSSPAGPSRTESPERQPSPEKVGTDYERTFKGPILRPNAQWAEPNRWIKPGQASREIPTEESVEWGHHGSKQVKDWSSNDFIRDHSDKHSVRPAKRRRSPHGLKTAPPASSVAEVWAEHLKSDDPRAVLDQLKDNERYPWKTSSFHHENRPPYRGTWTKKSVCVGPRTPFGQDPTIDYAYDSDAEWVDDEGDNVDAGDAADSEEDEEDDEDGESEGEFDDWLDDSKDAVKKKIGKRKITEIVPTWAGPLWEDKLGAGTPGMEDYRIRCSNDTPSHSIDPFNWVSSHPEQRYKAEYAVFAADSGHNVQCSIKSRRITSKRAVVKPAEPEPSVPVSTNPFTLSNGTTAAVAATSTVPSKPKAPAAPPAFPSLYLPQFSKIVSGSTQSEADSLQALKTEIPFASKATLKAKSKETARKVGVKKDVKWVVHDDAWIAAKGTAHFSGPIPDTA